jgi:hypothetical protein
MACYIFRHYTYGNDALTPNVNDCYASYFAICRTNRRDPYDDPYCTVVRAIDSDAICGIELDSELEALSARENAPITAARPVGGQTWTIFVRNRFTCLFNGQGSELDRIVIRHLLPCWHRAVYSDSKAGHSSSFDNYCVWLFDQLPTHITFETCLRKHFWYLVGFIQRFMFLFRPTPAIATMIAGAQRQASTFVPFHNDELPASLHIVDVRD